MSKYKNNLLKHAECSCGATLDTEVLNTASREDMYTVVARHGTDVYTTEVSKEEVTYRRAMELACQLLIDNSGCTWIYISYGPKYGRVITRDRPALIDCKAGMLQHLKNPPIIVQPKPPKPVDRRTIPHTTRVASGHKRSLSQEQLEAAYNEYYNYDRTKPRPTIAALARVYGVSTTNMYWRLTSEHVKREGLELEPSV